MDVRNEWRSGRLGRIGGIGLGLNLSFCEQMSLGALPDGIRIDTTFQLILEKYYVPGNSAHPPYSFIFSVQW